MKEFSRHVLNFLLSKWKPTPTLTNHKKIMYNTREAKNLQQRKTKKTKENVSSATIY